MAQKSKERRDDLVLLALLSNPTITAASKACGVSETQIRVRLRDPAFIERYEAERNEMLQQCVAFTNSIVSEAIAKMREIMHDPAASPQTQLNAADAIVRNCLKLTEETTLLKDVAELKQAVFANE